MTEDTAPKGVKTKLVGVVLLFAAMMDAMLHWRGGFALSFSTVLLCAAGILFYAVGTLRSGRQREQLRENER